MNLKLKISASLMILSLVTMAYTGLGRQGTPSNTFYASIVGSPQTQQTRDEEALTKQQRMVDIMERSYRIRCLQKSDTESKSCKRLDVRLRHLNRRLEKLKEKITENNEETPYSSPIPRPAAPKSPEERESLPSLPLLSGEQSPASVISPEKEIRLDAAKQEVIDLVNEERAKENLSPLRYNEILGLTAQAYAEQMRNQNFFSHVDPIGVTPKDRIVASGYLTEYFDCQCTKSYTVGENLGKGQLTAQQVVRDWMNSPDHKANIMNPQYSEIGIGIEDTYWVQKFGNISLVK